jgi:hypothetical protein
MIFAGETEVLGENLPSAILSTTNPTWIDPGANPDLRGERPATNRLSHGTAIVVGLITRNKNMGLNRLYDLDMQTLVLQICRWDCMSFVI